MLPTCCIFSFLISSANLTATLTCQRRSNKRTTRFFARKRRLSPYTSRQCRCNRIAIRNRLDRTINAMFCRRNCPFHHC